MPASNRGRTTGLLWVFQGSAARRIFKTAMTEGSVLARAVDPSGDIAGAASAAAGGISASRASAFNRAARHSRRVRWLKLLVPAAAVAMVVGFVGYSYISTPAAVTVVAEASGALADGKVVMANPKLEGLTKEGRAYEMTALRAIQDFDQQGEIDLEAIDARVPVADDSWAQVAAKTGVYDRKANTLQLATDIVLTTTDGMVARLNSAFMDIGTGSMRSTDPVAIERAGSTITADSMEMLDNGKVLVFERKVRMNIVPEAATSGGPASGGSNASN